MKTLFIPADIAQWVEPNVSAHYRLWVRISDWPTKIINSLSDEKLKPTSRAMVLYDEHVKKNQTELSVVSSCILALSPVTTNRLLGASLRWATGSDDKQTEITKPLIGT